MIPAPSGRKILSGDGTWPWNAYANSDDVVVIYARATAFGGANDPQDSDDWRAGK